MEYYFYIGFLALAVAGQKYNLAGSAENIDTNVDHKLDQVIANSGVNTNTKYDERPNYYDESIGGKIFSRNIEDLIFDKKNNDTFNLYSRRNYRYYGYDEGNPDIHGTIERPCQAYDTFCIRKFFAEHSQCKISGRAVPEPLYRAQSTLNVPNVNVSATMVNIEYTGIKDGRVEDFYINKVTDNLVITVDFEKVSLSTNNAYLKYYFSAQEPTVLRDFANASFLKLSITVVIPNLKDLRFDRAEIFTYLNVPVPPFTAGPGITLSSDPQVPVTFARALANTPTDAKESMLTEGNFYVSNYIQYTICDFGLKVL